MPNPLTDLTGTVSLIGSWSPTAHRWHRHRHGLLRLERGKLPSHLRTETLGSRSKLLDRHKLLGGGELLAGVELLAIVVHGGLLGEHLRLVHRGLRLVHRGLRLQLLVPLRPLVGHRLGLAGVPPGNLLQLRCGGCVHPCLIDLGILEFVCCL